MSEDRHVTEAFLAAIAQVEKGYQFANLAYFRRQKIKKMTGISRKHCECDDNPKAPLHPALIPVYEVARDDKMRPLFRYLPVIYYPRFSQSKYLPFLEICEIPTMLVSEKAEALDTLEKHLDGIARPVPVTLNSDARDIVQFTPEQFWSIRKQITHEATLSVGKVSVVYLDVFEPPEQLAKNVPLGPLFQLLVSSLDSEPFERHRDKMINSYFVPHLYTFRMRSFQIGSAQAKGA